MSEDQDVSLPVEEPKEAKPGEPEKEEEVTLLQTQTIRGDVDLNALGDHNVFNIQHQHGLDSKQVDEKFEKYDQKAEQRYKELQQQYEESQQRFKKFEQMFGERRKEGFGESESKETPDNRAKALARRDPFAKRMQEDAFTGFDKDDPATKIADLPETGADLVAWYRELGAYDKCFVQAMAIFDGASVPEITNVTRILYEPVQKAMSLAVAQTSSSSSSSKPEAFDDVTLDELLARTYTNKLRRSWDLRLFWQDANIHGVSQFKLRVLHFIAENVHMWTNSVFLELLQFYAERLTDENGSRAVRALGVIWWHQGKELQSIANAWTYTKKWYRAAYLLKGAYEVDRSTYRETADNARKSPILWLVQRWVKEAHTSGDAGIAKGCAAALTYALIGESSPLMALRGLDALLELPPPKNHDETEDMAEDIYEAVVLSHVDLAIYGYLREVLQHLAKRLDYTSYHRLQLTEMKSYQRAHHRIQRQIQLIAALDAFSRIASYSIQNPKEKQWVNYSLTDTFPPLISLENKEGKEMLLAGLLTGLWRSEISTLLCAAIIEKFGDFAFALLRLWADIILKDQGPSPDKVRKTYVDFIVELGQLVRTWCDHLVDLSFPASSAPGTFRHKLEKWQKEGQQRNHPIGAFAQEILAQVPL